MSEVENPVDIVIRLLASNMHVVKEDGSLASVLISKEWYRRELFKNVDGQVTVGLAETVDDKIEISGRLRRRLGTLKINVWAVNKEGSSDSGIQIREKTCEEINRIVRQNRNKPNETLYNFVGVGSTSTTHKAFCAAASSELPPTDASWAELSNSDYEKLWYSDNSLFTKSTSVNGEYVLMLFRFKITPKPTVIKELTLAFEGSGQAPITGFILKIWNYTLQTWVSGVSYSLPDETTLALTVSDNFDDFVDAEGHVWLLAKTRGSSDGEVPAILNCDYVKCTVAVNGITYLDIISFRDLDRVDTSPFIYRTEFVLRSWFFEDVG